MQVLLLMISKVPYVVKMALRNINEKNMSIKNGVKCRCHTSGQPKWPSHRPTHI